MVYSSDKDLILFNHQEPVNPSASAATPSASAPGPYPVTVFSVLPGRTGKKAIPDNDLLSISKMQESLEPSEHNDNEASREERCNVRLNKATFGYVSTWIPSSLSIVGSNYLSRLKSDSSGFKNFYRRFSGKSYGFSDQSMRIITGKR